MHTGTAAVVITGCCFGAFVRAATGFGGSLLCRGRVVPGPWYPWWRLRYLHWWFMLSVWGGYGRLMVDQRLVFLVYGSVLGGLCPKCELQLSSTIVGQDKLPAMILDQCR